jgi:arylmalonate decarboxylase
VAHVLIGEPVSTSPEHARAAPFALTSEGHDMRKDFSIGLVVPFATDRVPDEGLQMYPGVRFIPRGVGVRSLTPAGYDSAWEGILPAAEYLAGQGVDAIMVIGTSLTFYRGAEFHAELIAKLRRLTGLPVSTMSQAVVDGLRQFGAKRIAVATAYADDVNDRLKRFLAAEGFDVLALKGFGLFGFGEPESKSEADIIALGANVCADASAAQGLLISCGGLRTLGVAAPLEDRLGIPVVASTQAAFWAALRLVGESGAVAGRGLLLAPSPATAAPVH